ncbi:MAG: ATP-binding protein [Planctomycetota bacterium]
MLPFLDRRDELGRLRRALTGKTPSLVVLYGRRRCGKSRLLQQAVAGRRCAYYVGDDRDGALQRAAMAKEIARVVPGFDRVAYPDWEALLDRWAVEAGPGTVLALDEFPSLVAAAPELPSLLQKQVDRRDPRRGHLALAGSSQRMMQGLVLDRTAPLYGRAAEILRIAPLPCGWIGKALGLRRETEAVEAFATWGGVPRYWELARGHASRLDAVQSLVLSPLGVLHDEPKRLLLDDLRETAQAGSILALIGQGCHRLSEIAGRLGKPATSLSRPLARLLEMDLVRRDVPFGSSVKDNKRTLYRISDPFLRFWFRFVEPNRSRLEAGQATQVNREIEKSFAAHVSGVWEDLVRASVPRREYFGPEWTAARSWWGTGSDGAPMEIDVVAESADRKALLLGEAKWTSAPDAGWLVRELRGRAARFPLLAGRTVFLGVWLPDGAGRRGKDAATFDAKQVVRALR